MAPAPAVETTASLSMSRSVPALRSIAPLPPVAVTFAEIVRSSSSPPSLVAVSVMLPPSLLTTAVVTVSGLLAASVMLSSPLLSFAESSTIAPDRGDRPSTVPTIRAPVLDRAMSPESVVAPTVSVVVLGSATVSSGLASVPIPVSARSAAVAAVMSASVSPPSTIAPVTAVTWTSVVVTSPPRVMSSLASMSIRPDPALITAPLVIRISPVPAATVTEPAVPVTSPSAPNNTSSSAVIVMVPDALTTPLTIVCAFAGALAPFWTSTSPLACTWVVVPSEAISTLSGSRPPVMNRSEPVRVTASAESIRPCVAIWTPPIPSGVVSESAVNVMSAPAPVVVSVADAAAPMMMSRGAVSVNEILLLRSASMAKSSAPVPEPFREMFPPAAVSVELMSIEPSSEIPPPVPTAVVICELTVMVPFVALIVTLPPEAGSPVRMPAVATVPTVTSSTSVREKLPGLRSAATVSRSLVTWASVTSPVAVTCRFAARTVPLGWVMFPVPSDVNVNRSMVVRSPSRVMAPVVPPDVISILLPAAVVVRLPVCGAVPSSVTSPEPS